MILNKLKQMIKQAVISAILDDSSAYPRGLGKYNEKETYYTRLSPYGLDTHPPKDAWVILFSSQAQESTKFGMASDMLNRFKSLEEGEVVLYNTQTKDYIYLKANGDIDVDSKANMNINVAGDLNATVAGDVNVDADGDIVANAGGNIDATAVTQAQITAPTINLIGNVTIQGTLTQTGGGASQFSGDVSTSGKVQSGSIVLGTHVHSGVTTGGSNTGGPL